MGVSASSLLDDTTAAHVTDRAEAELQDFSPYYRGQYSAALFTQVEEDLEPRKEKIRQLLKQKEVAEDGEVLYEDGLLYFDENRKWRERYVVVRANHCLECHDGLETFLKGVPPRHKLLPTGGAVFTTEEKYMAAVDQCFPDECSEKEDFAPAVAGLPGQFPVYLRLPYRRDSYFCFRQQSKRDRFLSVLSDCIRHQNHDFLKKESVEVQSFLRAVQLYRQDQGHYDSWELLVGSDVRVMGNLVMEQLLPSLETELLPRLKAKKAEKKRVWFATVEAAYVLAQQRLLEGLTALKEECRSSNRQQEVLMLSDMDQIVVTRRRLKEAVRAEVQQPLQQLCEEAVQPHLEELLEELLQPISCGFLEGRRQAEQQMDVVCQDALRGDTEQVQQALLTMSRPNLLNCYQKVATLQEKLPLLQQRFGFSNMTALIDRAELELQQLMENTAFTFQQLLFKAVDQHPDEQQTAVEKVKHRVLKHYDYDSSSVRKRISREALVSITLPFIKRNLEKSCKTALQGLQQLVSEDHAHFIHVFNIYEDVLLSGLDLEVCKVVREAAALRKYDLFSDSRDLLSQSSRSSLSSPPSSPASPAKNPAQLVQANGLCGPRKEEKPEEQEMNQGASQMEVVMVHETQQEVEAAPQTQQKVDTEAPQMQQEVETEAPQTQQEVKAEAPQTQQEVKAAAPQVEQEVDTEAPQTQQEVETEAPQTQQEVKAAAPQVEQEVETEAPRVQREVEAEAPQTQQEVKAVAPQVQQEVKAVAPQVQQEVETEAPQVQQEVESEAPQVQQEVEAVAPQVQQGVETEVPQTSQEIKVAQKKLKEVEAEAPQTQQEVEAKLQPPEDDGVAPPCVQDCHQDQELLQPLFEFQNAQEVAAVSSGSIPGSGLGQSGQTSGDPEKETSTEAPPTEPSQQETCSASESPPPDSVREIRDLVVEVIEVEELLQRYPSGIPASQ